MTPLALSFVKVIPLSLKSTSNLNFGVKLFNYYYCSTQNYLKIILGFIYRHLISIRIITDC